MTLRRQTGRTLTPYAKDLGERMKEMKKNEMFKHIIAIRTAKNGMISAGTGILVKAENDTIYLVTATHVARDTTTNTDIWLRNPDTGFPMSFKINLLNPMVMWLYHPIADMAILEVKCGKEIKVSPYTFDLSDYLLNLDFFECNFGVVPERESIVTMFGMPDVYTDLEYAPFTCDSSPASNLWLAHFDVTGSMFKCFMLDKPSIQGFSGGPVVCLNSTSTPKCFGIIHGTRKDNTGGKLAIVVHSAYLYELLEYAKSKS